MRVGEPEAPPCGRDEENLESRWCLPPALSDSRGHVRLNLMEPSSTNPELRAAESAIARAEDSHVGRLLGYAARPAGARRLWRWIRPGSVLFFVLLAGLAAGAGWGAWKWRLAADRKAFEACTMTSSGSGGTGVTFTHAPSHGALRHLSRLPGPVSLFMGWPKSENASAVQAFAAADLGNVSMISMGDKASADLLLKELTRPDSGLKALTMLHLAGSNVTDAGLKELARPNSGLTALTWLDLGNTKVTDAGLKELVRPDCGLKALPTVYLVGTNVTVAGAKESQAARPGLRIVR